MSTRPRVEFQMQEKPFFLCEVAGDMAPQYLAYTHKHATLFLDRVEQWHNLMEPKSGCMNLAYRRDVLGREREFFCKICMHFQ